MNQLDGRGELALDIALCAQQTSIAWTLVEHQADLNARDTRGYALLHRAIERGMCPTRFKIYMCAQPNRADWVHACMCKPCECFCLFFITFKILT